MEVEAKTFSSLNEGLTALRPLRPGDLDEVFLRTFADISAEFKSVIAQKYSGRKPEDKISFQSALLSIVISDWLDHKIIPEDVGDWRVQTLLDNAILSYRLSQDPELTSEQKQLALSYRQTQFEKIDCSLFGTNRQ